MIKEDCADSISKLSFVINKEQLLQSLTHINNIVERRNSIIILSYVKIEAIDNMIKLTATDLDISIIASIKVNIYSYGVTTVSAQVLHDIIRKLPNGIGIEFSLNQNGKLSIVCDKSSFSLPVIDSNNFPTIEDDNFTCKFNLTVSELTDLFGKTKFAMSHEESRYNLNGIHFSTEEDMLCSTATDGHRLSSIKIEKPSDILKNFGIIVPKKTVTEILKIIDNTNNEIIKIEISERKIKFQFGNYILISKLIEGTFPNCKTVIPTTHDKFMLIDANILSNAIDRVSVVVSDKVKSVKFFLSNDKLILNTVSSDCSDATEALDVQYKHDNLEIGLNSRYLSEALSCIKGTCKFAFFDNNTAVLIQDNSMINANYIIMPMRI